MECEECEILGDWTNQSRAGVVILGLDGSIVCTRRAYSWKIDGLMEEDEPRLLRIVARSARNRKEAYIIVPLDPQKLGCMEMKGL